ncbi:MAG: hypothetical protein WAO52_10265 [Prolixibacteraceae bacterium]
MNSGLFRYFILFILLFGLGSWGDKAHRKISSTSVEFFPEELQNLKSWAPILADHSSDADFLKKTDKTEVIKHYIDLDNYDLFRENRRIPEDFNTICSSYGRDMVKKSGTLPWSTDSAYRALVYNFRIKNWDQAALSAANLGHYVADGYMPLHGTANYDGQLTNQIGVHSRYEETMIDLNIDKIRICISEIEKINSTQEYIFKYLYSNYSYIDSLLIADKEAFKISDQKYDLSYYGSLWEQTSRFTINLLEESSKTLASLIYTAWIEAGKPKIPKDPGQLKN